MVNDITTLMDKLGNYGSFKLQADKALSDAYRLNCILENKECEINHAISIFNTRYPDLSSLVNTLFTSYAELIRLQAKCNEAKILYERNLLSFKEGLVESLYSNLQNEKKL